MNPLNLGKQNGALVLEVLQVLGRPATIEEISQRVADIYKVARKRIQPVVGDILAAGVHDGFFQCYNCCYSVVQSTIDHLRQDIDNYVDDILSMDCTSQVLPKPSSLMIKLEQLDGSPPLIHMPYVMSRRSSASGELRERTAPGDAPSAVVTY